MLRALSPQEIQTILLRESSYDATNSTDNVQLNCDNIPEISFTNPASDVGFIASTKNIRFGGDPDESVIEEALDAAADKPLTPYIPSDEVEKQATGAIDKRFAGMEEHTDVYGDTGLMKGIPEFSKYQKDEPFTPEERLLFGSGKATYYHQQIEAFKRLSKARQRKYLANLAYNDTPEGRKLANAIIQSLDD